MLRIVVAASLLAAGLAAAQAAPRAKGRAEPQAPKADCSMFKKLSDGRWSSTIESKVGNPESFVTLQPGIPIEKDLTVVGINISDTIDRMCGGK